MSAFHVNEGLGGFWVSRGPALERFAVGGFYASAEEAQRFADECADHEAEQVWDYLRDVDLRIRRIYG